MFDSAKSPNPPWLLGKRRQRPGWGKMVSRLAEFEIKDLFGLYSHRIGLNLAERITIIIGPNGRGKTVCLKFIEALFNRNFDYFSEIPFSLAKFTFTNGEIVIVRPTDLEGKESRGHRPNTITIEFLAPNQEPFSWQPVVLDPNLDRELRRHVPRQWERASYDVWIDRSDGEELTLAELLQRYPVPTKLAEALKWDAPDEFKALLNAIDCHLIETQRLLVLPSEPEGGGYFEPGYVAARSRRRSGLVIQEKAAKLKSILKDALSQQANVSQSLDRSFPRRVIQEGHHAAHLSEDELRTELRKLEKRREALMAAGILDKETDYQALGGAIDPAVAKVLEMYVMDNISKLDVFNNLQVRLDLFMNLMKARFVDKSIQIDRENGFVILSKTGRRVPLDKLSSGEQHQLILIFDLLFEVTTDSFILIDEPELSLHVAWQRSFIESMEQIIALNKFDVLLATHSPALVAKHFNLAVELGPVDDPAY